MQSKDKRPQPDPIWAMWRTQMAAAAQTPWLASLLLKRGQQLWARFIYFYRRLATLPRHRRRALARKLQLTLAGAALALALSRTPSVHAATITVDGTNCTLVEAITTANDGLLQPGCVTGDGSGPDTIELQTDVVLTAVDNSAYGDTGLPVISSTITINGNNYTIQRSGATPFRILAANVSGDLTLNDVTITGGYGDGGGIANYGGTVTINNSTISGNTAAADGGGIANVANTYSGTATATMMINNSTISGNNASDGGGVSNYADTYNGMATATMTINNSTISGNNASNSGGGADNSFATESGVATATIIFNRSLVSGNTAPSGREVYSSVGAGVTADNYNLFGYNNDAGVTGFSPGANDIVPGAGVAVVNILNSLANNSPNGDPNTPEYPDTHALVSGSPAIDKAPDTDCTNAPTGNIDQRGGVRNVNGDGSPSANECDIGAYEYGSTLTPSSVTMQGVTTAGGEETAVPLALGITASLAVLSAGLLARIRRRRR